MSNEGFFIAPESAALEDDRLTYRVRLPWYRSLPLSSVEELEVTVDGRRVPADHVRLRINGGDYATEEMKPLWDDFWFVQDEATVVVPDSGDERPVRTITTSLSLRSPYIMIGPETPLITRSTVTQEFTVRKAAR